MRKRGRALDQRDREILRLLQLDAWLTHAQIGDKVHLSPSAVHRRIERMRSDGIIKGATIQLDAASAGQPTRLYMLIEMKDDRRPSLDALVEKIRAREEIIYVELLAGRFDVLLTVDCSDIEAFFGFAMAAINVDENILHVSTHTRIKRLI